MTKATIKVRVLTHKGYVGKVGEALKLAATK